MVQLRRRDTIDGIMVVGSTARDDLTPASDYDLAIVASGIAALVDMGHTIVDGRHANLRVLSVEELNDMIESGRSVNPYTHSGSTLLRLGDGRIEKDESGCLGRGRQKVLGGVELELLDDRQRYDRWWTTQGQHSRSQKTVLAATPSHEPPSRRSAGCQFKRTSRATKDPAQPTVQGCAQEDCERAEADRVRLIDQE